MTPDRCVSNDNLHLGKYRAAGPQFFANQSRRSPGKSIADVTLTSADWTILEGYVTFGEANLSQEIRDVTGARLGKLCAFPCFTH